MTNDNGTMMQYFEWYLPSDCGLWNQVIKEAKQLASAGITALWLPPAYKGAGGINDTGYAVYDLYDLGEFQQKGSIRTKYGTKEEYLEAIACLRREGIDTYGDIVLNHRIGADACEEVHAYTCEAFNRMHVIVEKRPILAWTRYNFPGRGNIYSTFQWNASCFDGVDWDEYKKEKAIFRFEGKTWDDCVDVENGNYSYLMGADVDLANNEVVHELIQWGLWYLETTGMAGFRLDALKHIPTYFYSRWLSELRLQTGKELFTVGEYWKADINCLSDYLAHTNYSMSLYDVPLHYNFCNASNSHGNYDMRTILNNTLMQRCPMNAVTFVDNHDTQPGQALQSFVQSWFRPLSYAIILLRQEGYPCVFYGDYYGLPSHGIPAMQTALLPLLTARQLYSYGKQHDYFDDYNIVGWTREGDDIHGKSGLAVLLSDGPGGSKTMYIGTKFADRTFKDITQNQSNSITISPDGFGLFTVSGGSASVWVVQ